MPGGEEEMHEEETNVAMMGNRNFVRRDGFNKVTA
jgi:hypothetical protein